MPDDAPPLILRTERLDLVLATPGLMAAALAGDEELALLLGASLASGWPPEFYDRESLEYVLTRLSEGPEQAGWWMAFFLLREPEPRLIGVGGYKGPPTPDGTVEFGYSVVREWQRRGLATEAAAEFLRHALDTPGVTRVVAETMPARRPSIRVLEKLGFTGAGEGSEPDVIRFEIVRTTAPEEGPKMIEELRRLLLRDLTSVRRELELYPDDASVWRPVPGVTNVAGTLALHLAGNLQHFVGATLGGTGYVRQRDLEFSRRDVPRAEMLAELERTADAVSRTLTALSGDQLDGEFPLELAGVRLSTRQFLLHLSTHLAYHLGQIDYHRRVVTGEAKSAGANGLAVLTRGDV